MLSVRDVILQDLIQNIFPDSLTGKIYWMTTDNQHGWLSKNIMLNERSAAGKRLRSIWFHLYELQEQAKTIYGSRSHFVTSGLWGEGSTWKGNEMSSILSVKTYQTKQLTVYFTACKIWLLNVKKNANGLNKHH